MADSKPLTDNERAELDELRANKDKSIVGDVPKNDAPLPDTHWLNLADGTTVITKGVASHVNGIPVLHATEIPAELQDGGNVNAEPAHRF